MYPHRCFLCSRSIAALTGVAACCSCAGTNAVHGRNFPLCPSWLPGTKYDSLVSSLPDISSCYEAGHVKTLWESIWHDPCLRVGAIVCAPLRLWKLGSKFMSIPPTLFLYMQR